MCFPLLLVLCDVVDEILEDEDDSETSDDDNGGKDTPSRLAMTSFSLLICSHRCFVCRTLSSRSNSVMKLSRSRTATMSRRGTVSRTSSNAKGFKGMVHRLHVTLFHVCVCLIRPDVGVLGDGSGARRLETTVERQTARRRHTTHDVVAPRRSCTNVDGRGAFIDVCVCV